MLAAMGSSLCNNKNMKSFLQKHRTPTGIAAAIFALGVATIYYYVLPAEAVVAQGGARFILEYGHSLCWILLAAAAALWTFKKERFATGFAYAALAVYVLFMVMLLIV
jgi:hypothetical protein